MKWILFSLLFIVFSWLYFQFRLAMSKLIPLRRKGRWS